MMDGWMALVAAVVERRATTNEYYAILVSLVQNLL